MQHPHNDWPYPRWIAHRGAGKLAPENTLAAFRLGASYGYRMFECDVKLSADGIPFLLHDATLERTTNAEAALNVQAPLPNTTLHNTAHADSRIGGEHPWATLSQLDAGSWHSRQFAGETLPTLDAIARYCIRNGYMLNIEIKPTPGIERHTGEVVAQHAARLWRNAVTPPLLTSFDVAALEGAKAMQPHLPRGLLLHELWEGWLEKALALQCQAIVCHYILWNANTVTQVKQAGLRALSYTVNDEAAAQQLIALGTDGIITDRVDALTPAP